MTNPAEIAPIELTEAGTPDGKRGAPLLQRDLAMVGHVEVTLTAVIGGCTLPIARLMELARGDVLALTAALDDPITLRLNDKDVARAELVAVGETFGVRITEVL